MICSTPKLADIQEIRLIFALFQRFLLKKHEKWRENNFFSSISPNLVMLKIIPDDFYGKTVLDAYGKWVKAHKFELWGNCRFYKILGHLLHAQLHI